MKRSLLALLLFGCGSGFSVASYEGGLVESDAGSSALPGAPDAAPLAPPDSRAGTGGASKGGGGGRVGLGSGGHAGLLDAAASSGGLVGSGGSVGLVGADSGLPDGGGGGACLTDLSGVGTGDFRISFTLTTTFHGNVALLSQRIGCDQSSMLWSTSLKSVLDEHGVSRAESDSVHQSVVDLSLVHQFRRLV